jgi:hypothetical protein
MHSFTKIRLDTVGAPSIADDPLQGACEVAISVTSDLHVKLRHHPTQNAVDPTSTIPYT